MRTQQHKLPLNVAALFMTMLAVITMSPCARGETSLTFVSWGGAYTRSQMLAFVRPYENKTGLRVNVLDYNGGLDDIQNQVRSLNVKWDVVDVEPTDAIRGCREGLFIKIKPQQLQPASDGTTAKADFIPGSLMECAVGTVVWSNIIAYSQQTYKDGKHTPKTLADFFDTARFPGSRGLRRTPKVNLEWALMADGVPANKVYDILATEDGLQRAFSKLSRLKPNIVWWEAGEEAPQLLKTGRVVMTSAYNGRIYDAVSRRDEPFEIVWDRQVWNLDLLAILKHTRNQQQALDFVRFATAPAQLAEQSRYIPYGPVRRSSLQHIEPAMKPYLPTTRDGFAKGLRINAQWWAQHYDEINTKFEQWISQPVQVPRQLPH